MLSRLIYFTKPRAALLGGSLRMFAKVINDPKASKPTPTVQPTVNKGINVKTLCEITGTKYYMHNEEINIDLKRVVRVYDDQDQMIADMPFEEAYNQAKTMKKDIVLRNDKAEPAIVKITNYRKDLLSKLFTKLGKDRITETKAKKSAKDGGVKAVHLTTTITVHDMENKKRKSAEFLKKYTTLKFFMKVNMYDDANIQKGRLMLLNIAEDLKDIAKVSVAPGNVQV
jgi:translation initiation factor IF-3